MSCSSSAETKAATGDSPVRRLEVFGAHERREPWSGVEQKGGEGFMNGDGGKTMDCLRSEAKKVTVGTGVAVGTFAVRPSLTTSACSTCVKTYLNNSQL